jgi:hypothetical protein
VFEGKRASGFCARARMIERSEGCYATSISENSMIFSEKLSEKPSCDPAPCMDISCPNDPIASRPTAEVLAPSYFIPTMIRAPHHYFHVHGLEPPPPCDQRFKSSESTPHRPMPTDGRQSCPIKMRSRPCQWGTPMQCPWKVVYLASASTPVFPVRP